MVITDFCNVINNLCTVHVIEILAEIDKLTKKFTNEIWNLIKLYKLTALKLINRIREFPYLLLAWQNYWMLILVEKSAIILLVVQLYN